MLWERRKDGPESEGNHWSMVPLYVCVCVCGDRVTGDHPTPFPTSCPTFASITSQKKRATSSAYKCNNLAQKSNVVSVCANL